jgi:hypothetical protein
MMKKSFFVKGVFVRQGLAISTSQGSFIDILSSRLSRLDVELACLIEHLNLVDHNAANVPLSNLVR